MFTELCRVKEILKVPRTHFKSVENSDYETLNKQFQEFLEKANSYEVATPGIKDRFRVGEILKRELPAIEDKMTMNREIASLKLEQKL